MSHYTNLADVQVARVRLIFELPPALGTYPEPLVYVDWYRPFRPALPDLQMHRLALASRNHHQFSEVIPLSRILRSCHLIPEFGREIPRTWESHTSLDLASNFLFNPYLRFRDFVLFRHLLPLRAARHTESSERPSKRRRL